MSLLDDFMSGKAHAVVENIEDQFRFITHIRDIEPKYVENWEYWTNVYIDNPASAGFSGFLHMDISPRDHHVFQYSHAWSRSSVRSYIPLSRILNELEESSAVEVDDSVCFF